MTRKSVELSELLREIGLSEDYEHYCAKRATVVKRLVKNVGVTEKVAHEAIKEAIELDILKTDDNGRTICIK